MSHHSLRNASHSAFLIGGFALACCACTRTSFSADKTPPPLPTQIPTAPPNVTTGRTTTGSPNEIDAQARQKICAGKHKALRVAFIVDNSESHGFKDGVVQDPAQGNLAGTDPVINKPSPRGQSEPHTDRQSALFEVINRMAALDQESLKKNPQFIGSEVGIAYFPGGPAYNDIEKSIKVSGVGASVLPKAMTNLKEVQADDAFKLGLWNDLKFTHYPIGVTPYLTGLTAARDLLKSTRQADDPREDIIIFLTDGLPTDERPSRVVEMRQSVASTKVYILSVFKPKNDIVLQNSDARASLKSAFENDSPNYMWARKPQNTDGYQKNEFERYWNTLLALPRQISDKTVEFEGSANLKPEIDKILGVEQVCL